MGVSVGNKVPDFSLNDQNGQTFRLQDHLGKKSLVIFFYPKDDTPGCTIEACSFRDSHEEFIKAGAMVIGISGDSMASHQQFSKKYQLQYTLLADEGNQVRKLFDVPKTLGLMAGRVTYILDKDGTVKHIFSSQFSFQKHIEEALATVRALPAT